MCANEGGLSVELLCVHHSLAEFSSGDPGIDEVARQLHERTRLRDLDDITALVVADESGNVAGIASVTDLILQSDLNAGGTPVEGLFLFYPLLAVDRQFRAGLVLSMLLDELERVRERRFSRSKYLGEIASPLVASGSEALAELLERRGFLQLQTDSSVSFRPAAPR